MSSTKLMLFFQFPINMFFTQTKRFKKENQIYPGNTVIKMQLFFVHSDTRENKENLFKDIFYLDRLRS